MGAADGSSLLLGSSKGVLLPLRTASPPKCNPHRALLTYPLDACTRGAASGLGMWVSLGGRRGVKREHRPFAASTYLGAAPWSTVLPPWSNASYWKWVGGSSSEYTGDIERSSSSSLRLFQRHISETCLPDSRAPRGNNTGNITKCNEYCTSLLRLSVAPQIEKPLVRKDVM